MQNRKILNVVYFLQSKEVTYKTGNQNMRKRLTHSTLVKILQTEFQIRLMVLEQCEFKF